MKFEMYIFLLVIFILTSCKSKLTEREQEAYNILDRCQEELQKEPDSPALYYYQATAYLELKQYKNAIVAASNGIDKKAPLPLLYCARGDAYYALREYKKAEKDYERLHRLLPAWDPAIDRLEAVREKLNEKKAAK